VAVPTGHEDAVLALEPAVEAVYCANLRGGRRFAVAEAYVHWCDVPDDEVRRILAQAARAGEP
jgi:predicted phosphoribosyltransferase